MEEKKSFLMFYDWEPLLQILDREDVGDLLMALYAYEIRNEIPEADELTPAAWGLFNYLSNLFDENKNKWLQKQSSGSLGGKRSAETRKNKAQSKQDPSTNQAEDKQDPSTNQADLKEIQPKDKVKDKVKEEIEISPNGDTKKTAKRFIPPTLEECRAYWKEKGFYSNPDTFFYFYDGKGWRVGKDSMKKWKSSAAGWENRQLEEHPEIKTKKSLDDFDFSYLEKEGII